MGETDKMIFPFHYGRESDQYSFYKVPKVLFHDEAFSCLSTDAKLLYGILLDRMELSQANNWVDQQGRVFIYYTIESIQKELQCGNKKAGNLLAELDDKKGIGLITRIHQGLTKPDKIFVHKMVRNPADLRVENNPPMDGKRTSIETEKNPLEMARGHPQTCQSNSSGNVDNAGQDMLKGRTIDTEDRNTYFKNTENNNTESINLGVRKPTDKMMEFNLYEEYFKEKLGVEILKNDYPYQGDEIDELLDLIVETCISSRETIRIGKEEKPIGLVKSKFMKLDIEHIRYVLDRLHENTTEVRNIKQYLLTTLYNAPMTISNYYTARVNHDMYGSG